MVFVKIWGGTPHCSFLCCFDSRKNHTFTYVAKKNKAKNQNQDVIAQDGNRVVLTGQPENGDYINATRLNMEENYLNRTWIVTQGRGGN